MADALVLDGAYARRNADAVEAVDVGDGSVAAYRDLCTDEGLAVGIVQLTPDLIHVGVVGLGFKPRIGGGLPELLRSRAVEAPGLELGL